MCIRDSVQPEIATLAVCQLAGQHGDARAAALFDLERRALPRLRLANDEVGKLFSVVDMLAQPQLERRLDAIRDEAQRIAAVQPLLDLALELRVEHLGRKHEAGPREHVFGHQLDALGQEAVHVDKALDGAEKAVLQPRLVRAAGHRRDAVDVAFADRMAVFGEGQAPGRALAFGNVLALATVGVVRAFEERHQGICGQRLHEVVSEAGLVQPLLPLGLGVAALVDRERNLDAGHQHGLAAQQVRQLGARQIDRFEVAPVFLSPAAALRKASGTTTSPPLKAIEATWPARHTVTSSRLASALVTLTPTP